MVDMNESSVNSLFSCQANGSLPQWTVLPQNLPSNETVQTHYPSPTVEQFAPTEPVPWNHTIPINMPWFQVQNPFPNAAVCPLRLDHSGQKFFHSKRKGEHFEEVPSPVKQFISEEVMTSRLKEMHISNKYSSVPTTTQTSEVALKEQAPIRTLQELEARLKDGCQAFDFKRNSGNEEPVLVLAPEIAKIETEPLLPRSIVNQLQKPTMEMVLWKPPGGLVDHLIRSTLDKKSTTKNSDENHNNNNDDDAHHLSRMELSPDEFSSLTKFNGTSNNIAGGNFQNFRAYTVPAMTQGEIDALEEEMNL